MKSCIAPLALSILLLVGCGLAPPKDEAQIEIGAIISDIQQALANVQDKLERNSLPPLKQVALTLQAVAVEKGGGTIKLVIFTFGATAERTRTQQIDLVLIPPKATNAKDVSTLGGITKSLEDAIVGAAEGVKKADGGKIPLKLSSLDVKMAFAVKSGVGGGGKHEFVPITIDLTGDLSRSSTHTLVVSFAYPK